MIFQNIGILHHPMKGDSIELAGQIEQFLQQNKHTLQLETIWRESAWQPEAIMSHIADVDLVITLGGDGTLLRAARMGAPHTTPMLGVKMGRLGFLAEIMPEHWQEPLVKILAGDYWLEERLMVRARVERPSSESGSSGETPSGGGDLPPPEGISPPYQTIGEYDALNDVVIGRGDLARVVRISAQLDGGYLTTYTCDGLIVSTATGSTGYALAVGGPILPPTLRNILLLPIAPHLSMDRAVVLSEGTEIRLKAYSDYPTMLTVDGQFVIELGNEDEVVVVGSPHLARFVRVRERSYFYQALMDKLKWTV
ncbi:MAG: NAD(+)/NADH kinase [Chloroflexota bacterium]